MTENRLNTLITSAKTGIELALKSKYRDRLIESVSIFSTNDKDGFCTQDTEFKDTQLIIHAYLWGYCSAVDGEIKIHQTILNPPVKTQGA